MLLCFDDFLVETYSEKSYIYFMSSLTWFVHCLSWFLTESITILVKFSIHELRIIICGLNIWQKGVATYFIVNWELTLGWPLWNICVTNDHGYVPLVANTILSFSHSWLITGFVTRLTRRVPLVELELLPFPEHLSPPPIFSFLCMFLFLDRCLFFFFWPLCCLFFDIQILITPLVSSNFSLGLFVVAYNWKSWL